MLSQLDYHLVVLPILPTCEELLHLIFVYGSCCTVSREDAENRLVHGVEGSIPVGFSFKLDNVNTLYSTSCFLVPILSNSVLILVWPASRCSTQAHCQSETNERCVICQQTASRQSRDSQLRELTKILTLQHPALFQHLLLACFLTILIRFISFSEK